MSAVISLESVDKSFGPTPALTGLTLSIPRGGMFGLIGPDGAGKTTTLRIICGLIRPDRGVVRVAGVDPFRTRRAATASIGYVSQRFSLYGDLTIDENVAFFAQVHGLSDFGGRRDRLLDLTGLRPFRGRRADQLSGGMKQKLALACTLVHEPTLLVLDEPTTGVDPVSRREFWKLAAEFVAGGLTVVLATPYLDEAERCHQVALLHEGRLLVQDEPARLQAQSRGVILEIVASPARRAVEWLARSYRDADVQVFGDRVHLRVDEATVGPDVARALAAAGVTVAGWRQVRPSLEDVFIERTEQAKQRGMTT